MPRVEQSILLKYTNRELVKNWLRDILNPLESSKQAKILSVESLGSRELPATVLKRPKDEDFIKPDFGVYKRHQHGTFITVDMLVKTEKHYDIQQIFYDNKAVLRSTKS